MAQKKNNIIAEILASYGVSDGALEEELEGQIQKAADCLGVSQEVLPEAICHRLKKLEDDWDDAKYEEYLKSRSKWLDENKDLLMVIYDLDANSKKCGDKHNIKI